MVSTSFSSQSLGDWLDHLLTLHPSSVELGLDRIRRVARQMGLDQAEPRVITLAGTNGKGTTAALLEQIYRNAGYRVGVYSSPHLLRYNERVRILGQELPDADHCMAFAAVEAARGDTALTFFEFGTLAALWLFARQPLDLLLLEIGLGGRLDAVNLIDPDVAVITTIDIDHQDWLGDDREQIGREKAGIMRSGIPVVCGDMDPPASIAAVAQVTGAVLYQRGREFDCDATDGQWSWQGAQRLDGLALPAIPLANAATALQVVSVAGLKVTPAHLRQALAEVRVPGRMQVLGRAPLVIADVAHNPQSADYLAAQLPGLLQRHQRGAQGVYAVVGMLADKDQLQVLAKMAPRIDRWYLGTLTVPRGSSAAQLQQKLPLEANSRCFDQLKCALEQAQADAGPDGVVVVFGSFYTVAEALALLS